MVRLRHTGGPEPSVPPSLLSLLRKAEHADRAALVSPAATARRTVRRSEEPACPLCLEPASEINTVLVDTACGHTFCAQCLREFAKSTPSFLPVVGCPLCRQQIKPLLESYFPEELAKTPPRADYGTGSADAGRRDVSSRRRDGGWVAEGVRSTRGTYRTNPTARASERLEAAMREEQVREERVREERMREESRARRQAEREAEREAEVRERSLRGYYEESNHRDGREQAEMRDLERAAARDQERCDRRESEAAAIIAAAAAAVAAARASAAAAAYFSHYSAVFLPLFTKSRCLFG